MTGIWHPAVYNPRITFLGMQNFWLRLVRAAGFLLVAVCLSGGARAGASDWTKPEGQFAAKIATVTGPGAVALEVTNRSSLSRADFEEIGRGLRSQLAALGLQFVNADQAAATIEVSLSEDLESYVWVAEIHQAANESSVVILSSPRSGGAPAAQEASGVVIHKALLWVQAEQILDVAVIDGTPTHMAVLDANRIALYKLAGTRWQIEQLLPVTHTRPWARDLRGRLVLRKDHLFDAYLPGVFCRSTASTPLALNCSDKMCIRDRYDGARWDRGRGRWPQAARGAEASELDFRGRGIDALSWQFQKSQPAGDLPVALFLDPPSWTRGALALPLQSAWEVR